MCLQPQWGTRRLHGCIQKALLPQCEAFSAYFADRHSIPDLHDTKLTEGERLVRDLWHYTPFSGGKTAKQVQRVAFSGSFFLNYFDL